jgi:uncharacterized protein
MMVSGSIRARDSKSVQIASENGGCLCWPRKPLAAQPALPGAFAGSPPARLFAGRVSMAWSVAGLRQEVASILSPEELERLIPAESLFPSPIPVQSVSSDEFMPEPQTPRQREFEARVKDMGSRMASRLGMSRRRCFQTAAGMATAFLAMNETYGPLFGVSRAEAAAPERAAGRARSLSRQFIMDMHTHFLRPGTRIKTFVQQRKAVGKAGWNPGLAGGEQSIDDLMFANYIKELYLDSDTKVALLSGAPSELPEDWFLTNEMKAQARAAVNGLAGSKRMLAHAVFTPGWRASIAPSRSSSRTR